MKCPRSLIFVLLLCASCGGPTPLSPEFAGTWSGSANIDFPHGGTYAYSPTLVITVAANTATVMGVCADGSGTAGVTPGTGTPRNTTASSFVRPLTSSCARQPSTTQRLYYF